MYPGSNLQASTSGERRSSFQHYSMSQVNNEKPVVHREHEEQVQTWGQPSSISPASYPSQSIDMERNYSQGNNLVSSSSSLFDRHNAIVEENTSGMNNINYQQQAYSNQYRSVQPSGLPPKPQVLRHHQQQQQQQYANTASSYSKVTNMSNIQQQQQQSGSQHVHDVPFFHGFRFQAAPGFIFCAREK